MERFKHLAVLYAGLSDDRTTLLRAKAIAERNRAKISAVAIVEPVSGVAQMLLGKQRVDQLLAVRQHELQAALDADLKRLELKPLRLNFLSGSPAIETIRFILRERCDLLVKVREKPETDRAIATTDRKLLRKCPVPVLLLKAGRKQRFTRILAAVDPDPSQPERLELHRNVLKLAVTMAEREAATLDVVHAWDFFSTATLQGPRFKLTADELQAIFAEQRQECQGWMAELLAPHAAAGVRIRSHLIQGDAPRVIIDLASKRRSDLLVMGTVARGGLPGLLIGNTAEVVLDSVACATLTVKPPDFVCPITA